MTGFLDSYAAERERLLGAVSTLEERWRLVDDVPLADGGDAVEGLLTQEVAAVRSALSTGQFSVGVFGLIKRGKSTLLNALVGREVTSVNVTPETAVPVYVEHGTQESAEVHFVDGRVDAVAVGDAVTYTSQQHNPDNQRGVVFVRQHVHSTLLENGVRLIDTPGLDDIHADDLYTRRTLEELDRVDAGLVVFLSPPTVGTTEMRFLQEIAARGLEHVVFVCNMYPQHYHDPTTRQDVLDYIGRQVAARAPDRDVTLLPICALEGWQGRHDGDLEAWGDSGVPEVLATVERQLVERSRRELLARAIERVGAVTRTMRDQLDRRTTLLADADAREEHRRRIEARSDEVRRQLETRVALAAAEADRRHRHLRTALEQFFHDARTQAGRAERPDDLEAALKSIRRETDIRTSNAARGLSEAIAAVVRRLEDELSQVVAEDEELSLDPGGLDLTLGDRLGALTIRAEANELDDGLLKTLGSAAAGGALAGGIGLLAVGALFGPLALVGGAFAGWRLGGARGLSGDVGRLRSLADERLRSLEQDVLQAFDAAATSALDVMRNTAMRRITGYVRDLEEPVRRAAAIAQDPARVEQEQERCRTAIASLDEIRAELDGLEQQLGDSAASSEAGQELSSLFQA